MKLAKVSRRITQMLQDDGAEINTNELISSLAIDDEVASLLPVCRKEYEDRTGKIPEIFKCTQNATKRKAITKANIIKMGTDFELKVLDASAFIEQGYDDEKKKNFIKLYYE